MKENRNYDVYRFDWKDWMEYIFQFLLKAVAVCYLFFDSYKALLLFLPFSAMDYKNMKKQKLEKQKKQLTIQFKSLIETLVISLNAGYSLESAFFDAGKDLRLLYEKDAIIFEELDTICSGLRMNIPIEQLLVSLGERSGNEDIRNFANVVTASKKSGGNLIRIIQKTVQSISDKIAAEEEIETMITAKKLESKIMMLMPYGILFYFRVCNGEFLEILYHNVLGIFLMLVFLVIIYMADVWAQKIMEIKV